MSDAERLQAVVKVAREWAESVKDYHTWDRLRGIWDLSQVILHVAGEPPVKCEAEDCVGRNHPCPDLEDLMKGPSR